MPSFQCQTCSAAFDVEESSLARFPGWKPRFCRVHSPKKHGQARSRRKEFASSGIREENLTLAQVLEKYPTGPADGAFTDGSSVPNPGPGGWGVVWVEAARSARSATAVTRRPRTTAWSSRP
jgi:hypothetical protein